MNKYIITALVSLFLLPAMTYSQKVAVKTNMLYWATTTLNLGVELALNEKYTFSLNVGWNPFTLNSKTQEDGLVVESKIKHLSIMPELKYWTSQSFELSYWDVHGVYAHFNMGISHLFNH